MFRAVHPEVLAPDWLPPVPFGRRNHLASLLRWLTEPTVETATAGCAVVVGPRGSGTSTLARLTAAEWIVSLPPSPGSGRPILAHVRVPEVHGPQGVAGALLQCLDPEYELRGFSVSELLAGFLRRLRATGTPAVVVLDDIGPGCPDLSRLVAGIVDPEGFLPEGGAGLPPLALVLAGSVEALHLVSKARVGKRLGPRTLRLPPYGEGELSVILRDRAERALGRTVPTEWVSRVVHRAVRAGGSARRAIEMLRHELVGPEVSAVGPVYPISGVQSTLTIEPPLLSALGLMEEGVPVRIGDLRDRASGFAKAQGEAAMPATTFWRRIIRLERAGVVRRTVRTGGAGGSLSMVALVRPLGAEGGPTDPGQTLPVGVDSVAPFPLWAAPLEEWESEGRSRRAEPSALPFSMTDDESA